MFTFDSFRYYLDGAPFVPLISTQGNVTPIAIDATAHSDLKWDEAKRIAESAVKEGKLLFWELDFGMGQGMLDLRDESTFRSHTLALDHFHETLLKPFQAQTFGVGIYRGRLDIRDRWSKREQDEELLDEGQADEEILAIDLFVKYLQRLSSSLPDDLLIFCLIDVRACRSSARIAQWLSRERFAHLHLAIQGSNIPIFGLTWKSGFAAAGWIGEGSPPDFFFQEAEIGVLIPTDEHCSSLEQIDGIFHLLLENGIPFRILAESQFSQEWEGLSRVIALPSTLTPLGKRMLKGFSLSEGEVIDGTQPLAAALSNIVLN